VPALGGWLVTSRALCLTVMRDADAFTVDDPRFSTGRVVGPSMLSRDGAEHRRHRDAFARPFRLSAVRERFTAAVAAAVDDLLPTGGRADLRADFAAPLAARVVADALGLRGVRTAEVLEWYAAIVAAVTAVSGGAALPESGLLGYAALRAAIEPELDRDPLSSLVAAAASDGCLDRDEVASNAAVLLFGGIETTEGMIASALLHVLERPEALAAVRADPELVPVAVEETLRLEPAAATVDRYATRDVQLGDARIPAGDLVIVSIAAANRDPDAFAEPDAYRLDRGDEARRHLAWAAGPHTCVGMHLARLEAHTAVRAALALPGLRLDPDAAPPGVQGLVFRKPPAVPVVWDF
jgi:cytochrome P450